MKLASILLFLAISSLLLGIACSNSAPASSHKPAGASQANPAPTGQSPATHPANSGDSGISSTQGEPSVTVQGDTLPSGWPDYASVMPGFNVESSKVSQGPSPLYRVTARGGATLDETQTYYIELDGWEKDPGVPGKLTGDIREIQLIRNKTEHLGIIIEHDQSTTTLTLLYRNDAGGQAQ